MYYKGDGVPQDYAQAVSWLRKAADQGIAHAQYDLGAMYYSGNGVNKDHSEALKWFIRASDNGDSDAKKILIKMQQQN